MTDDSQNSTEGLGTQSQKSWPKISAKDKSLPAIDRLKPGTDLHARSLKYILNRVELSEREMKSFYSRWQVAEKKTQAYIDLPDWEQVLKDLNDDGKPAKAVNITVPYTFATLNTIVTYLLHTYTGRKPMFPVGSNKEETARKALMMEIVLQYNADATRLIRHLSQLFMDGLLYGVGFLRCQWEQKTKLRTVIKREKKFSLLGFAEDGPARRIREPRVVYEGNIVEGIDPFLALPDPRVAFCDVNKRGEFFFWVEYVGKHELKVAEAAGEIKYLNSVKEKAAPQQNQAGDESHRSYTSKGIPHPGKWTSSSSTMNNFYEKIQGTIEVIPEELGWGEGKLPEKWLVTILNRDQIVQCEPFQSDHDMHPVVAIEPTSMGYGLAQPSMADYLAPIQDLLSWLINSHMDNVKTSLNNMFIVDPSRIEMQDFLEAGNGLLLRLKQAAYGTDVRSAITQLPVQDVTAAHVRDFETMMKLGDTLSSVTDNLRGLQDSGGRKTATEVRTSGEAAASRLAAMGKIISSQGIVDLTEMMSLNIQQYLSDDFYIQIVGEEGRAESIHVSPEMVVGDFYYPIHDGTLPLDKIAMLDIWKELYLGIANDPELRQNHDMVRMFEYVAELGGVKNLDQFKVQRTPAPDATLEQNVQQGNTIPLTEALDALR